ncbi:MAG: hypothetical protein QOD54_866, partial [Sphingomonadales bacterium]|nr:hypothetical protein [Sphingomonadales bacterium]
AVFVTASLLGLAACNKGPEVDLHNASANQVTQAVNQSGMMSGDSMVEPGLWQSRVTVQEMSIPGIPAQYAERMKSEMADRRNQSSKHCITPADVKKPKEDFFGADKSCRYDHFTMGGGKIDIQMACKQENLTQTTSMSGSYTPTTYSLDVSNKGTGPQQGMTMKMHVDAQRIGACTGKEG